MAPLWRNGLIFLGCSHVANALLWFSGALCLAPAAGSVLALLPRIQPRSASRDALGEAPSDLPRAPRASCYWCSYKLFLGRRTLEWGDQMVHSYLALSLPQACCSLEHGHTAGHRHFALGAGRGHSAVVQTHAWSGTQAHYPRRGRAKACPNILHKYLMAGCGVMLERSLGSGQSFGMPLPGGFPKGRRGVEWVGARLEGIPGHLSSRNCC